MRDKRSIQDYLESDAASAIGHARLLLEISRHYSALAPDYCAQESRVANLKDGVLVIHADNGAIAAKLRQMAPSLAEALRAKGYACNEIKIRVRSPADFSTGAPPPQPRPLSPHSRERLEELAGSLPPGKLRDAILQLLARSA